MIQTEKPHWIKFYKGNLEGIELYTTENFSNIYLDGNTDKEMMDSIKTSNPEGKIIFDVGAFIGASSLVFSKLVGRQGRVVAFEPNIYNLERFKKNINKNTKYGNIVSVYQYALSYDNKNISMTLSSNIDQGYSSTSRLEGSHSTISTDNLPKGFVELTVESKTLDTFVEEEKIMPSILKVDIEGAEYDFLLGAINTIRKCHPDFYIELHSQYCAAKCTELLIKEGYAIEVLYEENDNRIMIRATHENGSMEVDTEKLKILNDMFRSIKSITSTLDLVRIDAQIKSKQILNLMEENNNIKDNISKNKELEELNKKLDKRISSIESSISWKITKPLRVVRRKLTSLK